MTEIERGRFGRRSFLRSTAIGGAALGVAAATPGWFTGSPASGTNDSGSVQARSQSDQGPPADGEPVVALIRDASKGEIAVLWGEHEVVVTDAALAARLSQAPYA